MSAKYARDTYLENVKQSLFLEDYPVKERMFAGLKYVKEGGNGDGDADDWNESVLMSPQKLLDIAGIPARFDGKHHAAGEAIPENAAFAIGGFSRAGSGVTHFVVIGRDKGVVYDPLSTSLSIRIGKLSTMRWFFPKDAA